MTKLLITILCLASFTAAQTAISSTSQQHAANEKDGKRGSKEQEDIET